MSTRMLTGRIGRNVLVLGGLTGAFFAASLGLGVHVASAAYTARVQNGTLRVVGDGASDKLALRLAPGLPSTLQVDVGDDGTADFAFDRSTFTAIDVEAGAGDDTVRVDQVNGLLTDNAITLNGGSGDDILTGGDGSETLIGGSGDDFVDGNRGSDTALLGSGNDTFQWDPGDASDAVEGEGGHDTLAFNGSNAAEHIDISANGSRVRLFRDVAAVTMDLDGVDTVGVRTLGSPDVVTVGDLTGTDTRTVAVDLGTPDGAADTINVTGTANNDRTKLTNADNGGLEVDGLAARTQVTGGDAMDDVDVQTVGGDDTMATGVAVTSPVQATFDGGGGNDTSLYQGTSGDDQIGIALNAGAEAAFGPASVVLNTLPTVESLVVSGLDGNDTIAGQNGIATLTPLTIDGGSGDDTLLGGDGADLIQAGSGNDFVDGNRGNDTALLGSGNDTFQWDPGDASDTVEGQGGHDTLAFNGSNAAEHIDISANGSRIRLFRDVAAVTMDVNGFDTINVRTLGSADTVTVGDLTGTHVDTVGVDLGTTDGAADNVIVNGTDGRDNVTVSQFGGQVHVAGLAAETVIAGAEPVLDTLHVNALGGKDTVTVAPDVSTLIVPIVDLGDGQ
jgi:Ca2+-binding RTX toxin-like protein